MAGSIPPNAASPPVVNGNTSDTAIKAAAPNAIAGDNTPNAANPNPSGVIPPTKAFSADGDTPPNPDKPVTVEGNTFAAIASAPTPNIIAGDNTPNAANPIPKGRIASENPNVESPLTPPKPDKPAVTDGNTADVKASAATPNAMAGDSTPNAANPSPNGRIANANADSVAPSTPLRFPKPAVTPGKTFESPNNTAVPIAIGIANAPIAAIPRPKIATAPANANIEAGSAVS